MAKRKSAPNNIDWDATTWEGSRLRQLERWSKLSLEEILDAQEQMAVWAREVAAGATRKGLKRRA